LARHDFAPDDPHLHCDTLYRRASTCVSHVAHLALFGSPCQPKYPSIRSKAGVAFIHDDR
jgi:hypothetical protein